MNPLVVHHHLVTHEDGREHTRRFVRCPDRDDVVDVRECNECTRGRGLSWDERLAHDVVDCSVAPVAETSVLPSHARRAALRGDPLDEVTVEAAMSRDVICVTPECRLDRIGALMAEEQIGAVVVVDPDHAVMGVVSTTILATVLTRPPIDVTRTARQVMAPPLTVPVTTRLTRAAAMMAFEGSHHFVVLDAAGRLAGVLSSIDILRYLGQASGCLVPRSTARQRRVSDIPAGAARRSCTTACKAR